MAEGKVIIVSAPSGCGKSTIIAQLFNRPELNLSFSISATTRSPRGEERHGVEYYFLSEEEFRARIENDEFIEYEEVYAGRFYGTLRSEVDRLRREGRNVMLDIDVVGALNVRRIYGDCAMAVFIMPPSLDELRRRLTSRNTDSPEAIEQRLAKAEHEIGFAPRFDHCVVNDKLETAVDEIDARIRGFVETGNH